MKKILSFILALLIAVVPMVGCNDATDSVGGTGGGGENPPAVGGSEAIQLSTEAMNLSLFAEATLTATLDKEGTVVWNNSNQSVINTVANGNEISIVAINSGSAIITATSGNESATCIVSVGATDSILALTVGVEQVEIRKGGELFVPATVIFGGEEFEKANVTYQVEDASVASVTDGVVKGLKAGSTVINVSAEYYGHKSNICSVPVTVKDGAVLKVSTASAVLYDVKESSQNYPNKKQLTASVVNNGVETAVSYTATVQDEQVAKIQDGYIVAVGTGSTTISISCEHGGQTYTATVTVKVVESPKVVIKITESDVAIFSPDQTVKEYTHQLSATVTVEGTTVSADSVTYSLVEGEGIITVSSSGLITSIADGSAKVKATYNFQGTEYSDICAVTVKPNTSVYYGQHEKFAISGAVVTMTEGDTLAYEGITHSNDENKAAIRLQIIQSEGYNGAATYYKPKGARHIFITLQDANNTSNYITVLLTTTDIDEGQTYWKHGATIGVRSGAWGNYTVGSTDKAFTALKGPGFFGIDQSGYAGYNYGIGSFSFYNEYLNKANATDYMMGISVKGTSVYMITFSTSAGKAAPIQLLDLAAVDGRTAWTGFGDNAKLNVYVTTTGFNGAEQSHLVVDTIGGNAVTKDMTSGFRIADLGTSLVP